MFNKSKSSVAFFFLVITYNVHWCNVTILCFIRNIVRINLYKIIDIAPIKVF